jgi:linoleoyl-CoA desaturase
MVRMHLELDPPVATKKVRFIEHGAFMADLNERADAYFAGAGRTRRDVPTMYLKTLLNLTWFTGSWVLLVFFATTLWQAVLLAMSLGFAIAAIGMGVQHDANHGAYSQHPWVNRLLGFTLDVMGVCSFFWRQKHNVIHHTYTNIQDIDFDLDFGVIARLSPEQALRPWQRYQHYYIWFLYGFLLPKWVFRDDFVLLRTLRAGPHKLVKPNAKELFLFYFWKLFFVAWSIVIPLVYHPLWQVVLFHLIAVYTMGVTLSTVFQLAHCVEEADFPPPAPDGKKMSVEWAVHQVQTTVDFSKDNGLLTWFVGGLGYQVEHHLFPKVCHMHYPALAKIVTEVSEKHGIRRRIYASVPHAIASHYRHLRRMGRAEDLEVVTKEAKLATEGEP